MRNKKYNFTMFFLSAFVFLVLSISVHAADNYEPNDTMEQAASIDRDQYKWSYMSEDNVDYFKVLCLANREETFTFLTNNDTLTFQLLDAEGKEIPILKKSSASFYESRAYNYKLKLQESKDVYIKVMPRTPNIPIADSNRTYHFQFGEPSWLHDYYSYKLPPLYYDRYGRVRQKLLDLRSINVPDSAIVEEVSLINIRPSYVVSFTSQIKPMRGNWSTMRSLYRANLSNFNYKLKNYWYFKTETDSTDITPNGLQPSLYFRYKYELGTKDL